MKGRGSAAARLRAVLASLALACASPAIARAPGRSAIPEGTQGLAYSEHSDCGVDGAIISFWKSFQAWLSADGTDAPPGVPEARDDYLRKLGTMPRSRPCVACLSADVAIRRFAPLALAASGKRVLAEKLRHLDPVRTPAGALATHEKVLGLMERARWDESRTEAGKEAIDAALASLQLVGNLEGVLGDEYVDESGRWCVSFSAMEEYEDKTMETLAFAVGAGVPRRQAVLEARRLLKALVRSAATGRRIAR